MSVDDIYWTKSQDIGEEGSDSPRAVPETLQLDNYPPLVIKQTVEIFAHLFNSNLKRHIKIPVEKWSGGDPFHILK